MLSSEGVIAAMLATLAALAATPANAGDVRCLWAHLPAERTANVLSYDLDAISEVFSAAFSTAEFDAAGKGCGVTPQTARYADQALHAYALQLKTEQVLAADARLSAALLDKAWMGLDPKLRDRLAKAVLQQSSDPDILDLARQAFVASLGLTDQLPAQQRLVITDYLVCRSIRAVDEPRF